MNVWFKSNYAKWEKELINNFISEGIWNEVIWTSIDLPESDPYHPSNCYYTKDYTFKPVPSELIKFMMPFLWQYIDMSCRFSSLGSNQYDQKNPHDYQNEFMMLTNKLYHKVKENNIDLLVLLRAHHQGHDLVLYYVCKFLKVKTLILENAPIFNYLYQERRFFYYWENEDYGNFNVKPLSSSNNLLKLENEFKKDLPYMKVAKKKIIKKIVNSDEVRLGVELFRKKNRSQALYRYLLKKSYKRNSSQYFDTEPNINQPYIYFGLHLQPEKTTSNFGGIYTDQVLAIEQLAAILPSGWKIFVKENPKQDYFMRCESFYQRLNSIPNLVLIKKSFSTYKLLQNCKLAATITGTLGFEAITGGKNVIYFGFGTWYKSLPGTHEFNQQLDLEKISSTPINHDILEKKFTELYKKTLPGFIYFNGANRNYFSKIELLNVVQSLKIIIESNK